MAKGEASVRDRAVRGPGREHCGHHRPWATLEGHAGGGWGAGGIQAGSLAIHRTMAGVVFSLDGEGGTEFSPSSFFSDSSSPVGWELWPHEL